MWQEMDSIPLSHISHGIYGIVGQHVICKSQKWLMKNSNSSIKMYHLRDLSQWDKAKTHTIMSNINQLSCIFHLSHPYKEIEMGQNKKKNPLGTHIQASHPPFGGRVGLLGFCVQVPRAFWDNKMMVG